MAFLKYTRSIDTSNFEYSDVSTYVPGWGTWGSTFGRDWDLFGGIESDYVKVKPKSITYYPYNFSGKIKYKGRFVVPSEQDYYDIRKNASGYVKSIKAVVNGQKLTIKKIDWDLKDIVACDSDYYGVCEPRLDILFSEDDIVKAGANDTAIETYGGDDKIIGNEVSRSVNAGDGDDLIEIRSSDRVTGGSGSDVFVLRASANGATIVDFEIGDDKIKLKGKGFESVEVKPISAGDHFDTLLSWSGNSVVRILQVDASYAELFG